MEKLKEKIKELNPDKVLEKFLVWFDSRKRMAFLITLIVGIITHISMITDMIMSQDGLWNSIDYYRPGHWEVSLGRWGIALIERFNFFIAIPTVSTISCILAMSIAAVFIVDLFDFKSKISIIFTSLILVLTPTLTATLLYIYTAFAYTLNFLIATLVIWFLYKFKHKKIGFVFAAICFMLTLSIYQSYIGIAIGLCVMVSIIELIKSKKTIKEIFLSILKTIGAMLIGVIAYYCVTQVFLKNYGLEMTSYQNYGTFNIENMLNNLGTSIIESYKDFFGFFLGNDIIHNTNYRREIFNGIFLIVSAVISLISIIFAQEKDNKYKVVRGILSVVFLALIPLALNIIDVLVVGNDMYSLTAVQMILMIPFTFCMFEMFDKTVFLKWIAIISCIYMMGTYYIADNTSYAALKLTYNQAYSTTVRILDRIENTEGYNKYLPWMFGGIVGNDNYPRTSNLYTYTVGSIVTNPTFHGSYSGAAGTWTKFIKIFFGLDIGLCSPDTYYNIVNSEEYKQMEIFPSQESVKIINGVIVVKLSDNPDLPY